LSTVIFLTYAVATPAVIHVLNKHSLRKSVLVSAACAAAGYWIRYVGARIAGQKGFGITMFGQVLIGFAQPFVLSAPTHFSDLWFTSRGRVGATAVVSLANPFGAAVCSIRPAKNQKTANQYRLANFLAQ
jgi:FLVCR family MFS transporter 7